MQKSIRPTEALRPERWLEHLNRHLPIARAGLNREGVHQVRVSAARLETYLRLAARRSLRDDLRWLRERASAVRDLDVLLERELPAPFAEWLVGERLVARAGLIEALESPRLRALLEGWRWVPELAREDAAERRERLAVRAERRAHRALDPKSGADAFHAVRRALRRLRYADEWLGRDVDALKALQESLGLLNDVSVARRLACECPCASQLAEFLAAADRDLERRVARARLELARHYRRKEKV
ncbi:MAG: CHAD domain-containing protein [Planctomycetes bacterium]|nr:CHAD domain-containing protein [Planctomycetota bacterium]